MRLSKNIRYLVRVRDYETVHVEVGAEADFRDLGIADSDAAHMAPRDRIRYTEDLHKLVNSEVAKLAREELQQISQWSEITPNLAQDFLSSGHLSPVTPVTVSRSPNARNEKTAAASKRSLRRTPPPTTPAA